MAGWNGLSRRFGLLVFSLMVALGLLGPQMVGAAKPSDISPNQPSAASQVNVCALVSCPKLPAISDIVVGVSYDGVRVAFDEDMSGDPLWGKGRVEIWQNGQMVAHGEQYSCPGGKRHLDFAFNGLNAGQQYVYRIYRLVGADSYMPHFYEDGTFQTT